MKTISGREINVSPNHSKRTFTIRITGTKYRTLLMGKEDFNNCLHNGGNDWQNFLRYESYYKVN